MKGYRELDYVMVKPELRKIVTSLQDLILVSRILQWASTKNPFYKTNLELSYETGLTRKEILSSKKRIEDLGFLEITVKGMPRKTYYKVNWRKLDELLSMSKEIKNKATLNNGKLEWNISSDQTTTKTRGICITDSQVVPDQGPLELKQCTPIVPDQGPLKVPDDGPLEYSSCIPVVPDEGPLENTVHTPVVPDQGPLEYTAYSSVVPDEGLSVVPDEGLSVVPDEGLSVVPGQGPFIYKETTKRLQRDYKETAKISIPDSTSEEKASKIEDEPQSGEAIKTNKYPAHFELVWTRYRPKYHKQKGNKKKAYEAYQNAIQLFSEDEIVDILDKYMESTMFELGPAHLSTFLNGISKDSKYREEFVEGGFEKRLDRVKGRVSSGTSQEKYRNNIAVQGDLNANDLIDRTAYISVWLSVNHGLKMRAIEDGDRSEWLPYLGPEYVAIPIKHPLSKTDKVKVLFHIDELRSNAYTHLHGHEWNDELESRYQESNKGIEWIDTLQLPNKEEYK